MFTNRRLILPVSVLILALLACNTATATTPASNPDTAGTAVAQTLTAQPSVPVPGGSTATAAPAPTLAVVPTNTTVPAPTTICDNGQFVSETIPDGTIEVANASFTKTWRLKNVGACTWNASYAVVFDNGTAMGAPAAVPLSGNVAPGQVVDVAVPMQAPSAPGNYTGNWKLRNASGVLFGLGASNGDFWVKITVPVPTPTTAPTSSGPSGPVLHIPLVPLVPLLLVNTQQVLTQVTAPAGGIGHAVVNCPSGTVVTGGGFAGNSNLFVYSDSATGNGWEVDAQNTSGSSQLLNSYAICLANSSGTTQQVYAQVTAPGSSNGHAVVSCPSGSVVTGGGFAGNSNLLVFNTSIDGNGWGVYAQNNSGSGQLLNSYAICLSGTAGSTQQVVNQVTVPGSSAGQAIAACPSGTYLTGGGYAGSQNLFVYSDAATGTSWEAAAQNLTGSGQLLNSYVICLTLP